ncbi:hypothetical protein MesoLj131a_30330 [Mesorhizobium sp. 131-2-1]|nr:hypothetical protein MesoLj131a_30330 [Mesorhizobium sp. 131-2-1]
MAEKGDTNLLVEMQVRALSCAALAFLARDDDTSGRFFRLAERNLNDLLELRKQEGPGGEAASWMAFKQYEIETRDYILGYDYARSVDGARDKIHERLGSAITDFELAKQAARDIYATDECPRIEKFTH